MNLWVLNKNFEQMAIIDAFESLIWTDRYYKCGDFELVFPASPYLLNLFRSNEYLVSDFSDTVMVIEGIELESDSDDGDVLTITGRSIESILDRRIVIDEVEFSGNIQDGIAKLLNDNFISPTNVDRKVPELIFDTIKDSRIDSLTVDFKTSGDSIYELIENLCSEKKVGFRIKVTPDNKFHFSLYLGVDRSYQQTTNEIVMFSNSFDNIVSSNYIKTISEYKNVVIATFSKDNVDKKIVVTKNDQKIQGLDRREASMSADSDKNEASIKQDAKEFLTNNSGEELIEGEIVDSGIYRYGRDYYIGDIVELENDYGLNEPVRVIEYVRNESESGVEVHPTFEVLEEQEGDNV